MEKTKKVLMYILVFLLLDILIISILIGSQIYDINFNSNLDKHSSPSSVTIPTYPLFSNDDSSNKIMNTVTNKETITVGYGQSSSSHSSIGRSGGGGGGGSGSSSLPLSEENSSSFLKQESESVQRTFSDTQEYALSIDKPISSFSIKGNLNLDLENSIIRVILIDKSAKEYLVLEKYPLISDNKSFNFENYCEETCLLDNILPDHLRIYTFNSTITIDSFNYSIPSANSPRRISVTYSEAADIIDSEQESYKIQQMNENIQKGGMLWIAGNTSISELSYEDKKGIIGTDENGELPNLEGFDYYSGGIFEFASQIEQNRNEAKSFGEGGDNITDSWDWRTRHGATSPNSAYYSGSSTNGWVTSIKDQTESCQSCWAFSSVSAVELLTNLYFNQNLSLDLSEQEVLSCTGGVNNCVEGGYSEDALNYIKNNGVTNESDFPYTATDNNCLNKPNSTNLIKINGNMHPSRLYNPEYFNESMIKRVIIENGSIVQEIGGWTHFVNTIGFGKVNETSVYNNTCTGNLCNSTSSNNYTNMTYWLFKNSYGSGWGENGYGKIILSQEYIEHNLRYDILSYPIISTNITYNISCRDEDLDGYCNWGINPTKLGNCPATCSLNSQKDCDDSNFSLGIFNNDYSCSTNTKCRDYDGDGYADVNSTTEPSHSEYWGECTSQAIDCSIYNSSINPGATEICNGIDDNCNGQIDEVGMTIYYRDSDGDGYGNNNDNLTSCSQPVGYIINNQDCNDNNLNINPGAAEVCDNLDNNCNTVIDESLTNTSTCGVGACYRSVFQTCSAGIWNPSCIPGTPTAETCNNIDDNCDGNIDGGITNTVTCGVGACYRSVFQTCSAGNWGPACTPGSPTTETCNGIDDDCDGFVDNGLTAPSQSCSVGIGACARTGTQYKTCNGASGWSNWGSCSASPGSPTTETCNNIDDDCNGVIDNGVTTTSGCNQVGYCSGAFKTCSAGNFGACSKLPQTETCNGIDDNCDGSADNGLTAPSQSCSVGIGACARTGTQYKTCNGASGWSNWGSCSASPGSPIAESCNNIDDNCNGQVDESLTTTSGCSQTGYCSGAYKTCSAGGWGGCSKLPTTETCNNVDDNCNSQVDEGWTSYPGRPANSNQQGVCSGSLKQCSSGSWVNWYSSANIPFYENPEEINADGRDNNCDGVIDESLNFFPNFMISLGGATYHMMYLRLGENSCSGAYDSLCSSVGYNCFAGPIDTGAYGYGAVTGAWCYKECIGCSGIAGQNIDALFVTNTGIILCNGNDKLEIFYINSPPNGGVFIAAKYLGSCNVATSNTIFSASSKMSSFTNLGSFG